MQLGILKGQRKTFAFYIKTERQKQSFEGSFRTCRKSNKYELMEEEAERNNLYITTERGCLSFQEHKERCEGKIKGGKRQIPMKS